MSCSETMDSVTFYGARWLRTRLPPEDKSDDGDLDYVAPYTDALRDASNLSSKDHNLDDSQSVPALANSH